MSQSVPFYDLPPVVDVEVAAVEVQVEVAGVPGPAGADGSPGADGPVGPPGPTVVSADSGNTSTLGSDSFIYTNDRPHTDTKLRWVRYMAVGQSFLKNDVTRSGEWTMVANKDTVEDPIPVVTGPTANLLGSWNPTLGSGKAAYRVRNNWTVNQSGYIEDFGVLVPVQNIGFNYTGSLLINGTITENIVFVPTSAGEVWRILTPIPVSNGTTISVQVDVSTTATGNPSLYWHQQVNWFSTLPMYCSSATGSKDGGIQTETAYGAMVLFTPATMPVDWDVMSYQGGGGGGGGIDRNTADMAYLNVDGDTMEGPLVLAGDPEQPLEAAPRQYVDTSVGTKADASHNHDSRYMSVVNHGTDPAVARPAGAAAVYWIGSVAPTNAALWDQWVNTS